MIKYAIVLLTVFFLISTAHAQSLAVNDLIKLVNLPYDSATDYITAQKQFKLISSTVVYKTPIYQYGKGSKTNSESVVKSQWRESDKAIYPFVHYDFKQQLYAKTIIKQLADSQFNLKSKEVDTRKTVWLYENDRYLINIYTYTDTKLSASLELHVK
jgi:hypothetical protein